VTRTETGSVGLTFAALFPGRMLTCACGRGGWFAPNEPVAAPEQAVSNTTKTSNINTRRMVPAESARIAPWAQPIAGVCHIGDKPRWPRRIVGAIRQAGPDVAPGDVGHALHGAATKLPRSLRVLIAPFALRTARKSEVQPDVLVAR
jgi:hypothetical protein